MNSLRIVQLTSENVKALKAVHIVPKGDTVVISGRNAQGKTSVLDSIEYALAGKDAICEKPIRDGQSKARIICDLGDIIVERTFSAVSEDSALRIKTKDGKAVKSPQALLDELCSHVAFDPLSFVRMRPAQQVETLSKLVGIDFNELNSRRQKAYDDRTLSGRQLDAAKTRLSAFPFHPDVPEQVVNITAANEKLQAIKKQREANAEVRRSVLSTEMAIANHRSSIAGYEAQIHRLEQELAAAKNGLVSSQKSLAFCQEEHAKAKTAASKLVEDNESEILAEISSAQAINDKVRANARHNEQNTEVQKHQFEVDRLTHEIESIDQEKQDRLTWAEFPLDGLSFDDLLVLLNGIPFTQCSQAQQLQAAVAIGLALNPKVRVILIRDASLLDDDSMRLVGALASKHEAQIWMEVVNSKDPSAVVIEAGEVMTK